jgi:two-component system phosphate regulon response regulator PhoB
MGSDKSRTESVLIVEYEPDIVELDDYHLAKTIYIVSTEDNGEDALQIARQEKPALIVLDLMLPGMSGFEVIEKLRADDTTESIAVLMLTARSAEEDRIRGLSLGADDYLTKPFSAPELVLRVGNILRRMGPSVSGPSDVVVIGPIRIDKVAPKVTVDGQEIDLTVTEFKLLLTLAERRGRVQGRGHLLQKVWEASPDIQTRTVDMHVQRLRNKLGSAGDLIETVRGCGYRLSPGHTRSGSRGE